LRKRKLPRPIRMRRKTLLGKFRCVYRTTGAYRSPGCGRELMFSGDM
jgi:hypothetical protein